MTAIDQTPYIKLESQRLADNLLRRAAEFFRTHEQRIYRRAASFFARLTVMSVVEAFTRPLRELERLAHAGDLSGARALLTDVRQKFPRVQSAFSQLVQTPPTAHS